MEPKHSQNFIRLLLPLLLITALFFPAGASGMTTEEEELRAFISARTANLELVEREERALLETVSEKLSDIRSDIDSFRRTYQQIVLAQGVAGPSPFVAREIHAAMLSLVREMERTRSNLEYLRSQTETRAENLNISESEIDYGAIERLPAPVKRLYENYLARLRNLKRPLEKQSTAVARDLKSVGRLIERATAQSQRLEKALPDQWRSFFLSRKAPVFSREFRAELLAFGEWLDLRLPVWKESVSLSRETILPLFLNFAVALIVLTGLGGLAARSIDPDGEQPGKKRRIVAAWFLGCIGLAVFIAENRAIPQAVGLLNIAGASLLAYGVLRGGLIFRRAFCGYKQPSPTALVWLFPVGGLLLISAVPEEPAILLWLGCALPLFITMQRRSARMSVSPALQGWFWFLAALIPAAAFGYGRLAAFGGIICVLTYFSYTVGTVGVRLVSHCTSRLPDEGFYPFLRALALGLASPLIWTGAVGLAAFWVYDFMGSGMFRTVAGLEIGWQGFTLRALSVVTVIALIFLTRAAVNVSRASIERIGSHWPRAQRGTVPSLQTISSYALWALFGVLTLNILGVDLTSLTVIAGGLSVGIGFGMQNIINNFISGLILLFGRSLRQGDIIQLGDLWCTVKKINIRTTAVETFENATIMIPNSDLVTNQMTNWTRNSPTLRRDIIVGVAYGSDTELVRDTLREVALAHPRVLKQPEPWIIFNDFGSSTLDFILRVWVEDIDFALSTVSDLRFAVDRAFRERGIEIAFPQLDLHIRSSEGLNTGAAEAEAPAPVSESSEDITIIPDNKSEKGLRTGPVSGKRSLPDDSAPDANSSSEES